MYSVKLCPLLKPYTFKTLLNRVVFFNQSLTYMEITGPFIFFVVLCLTVDSQFK